MKNQFLSRLRAFLSCGKFSHEYWQSRFMDIWKKKLLPDEQKGYRRQSRGTKGKLMIGKMVMKNCKRKMTNLSVAWIDYTKVYDMVPHTWILQCLKISKVANNISNVIEKSVKNWKVELTS